MRERKRRVVRTMSSPLDALAALMPDADRGVLEGILASVDGSLDAAAALLGCADAPGDDEPPRAAQRRRVSEFQVAGGGSFGGGGAMSTAA